MGTSSSTSESAESAKASESSESASSEDTVEDVVDVEVAESGSASGCTAHSGMSELVVACTLVLVAQHTVCFGCFLELFFSLFLLLFRLVLLFVGVVLDGELAVCLLDFSVGGGLAHTKHFVIVSLFSHNGLCYCATATLA